MLSKKKIKKSFKILLQYGWMWGWPKHISKEGWDDLKEYYKMELNNGKDFSPDKNNKASVSDMGIG